MTLDFLETMLYLIASAWGILIVPLLLFASYFIFIFFARILEKSDSDHSMDDRE